MKRCVAIGLVLALAAAGEQERLVTDRDVRYGGEKLDGAVVAMSCRAGAWVEEFEHGIFKPDDFAMFRTNDEKVEVIVSRERKKVLEKLQALEPGTEITVFGKVHWAKGIDPYVVMNDFKPGYSQAYEPKEPEEIVLTFGGKPVVMERGKSYTLVTPKGEKVEAKWETK